MIDTQKQMQELLMEIDAMDETLFGPRHKKEPTDKLVGIVEGWPRKVFALALMYGRESDRLAVEERYSEDKATGPRLKADAKRELLMAIFWNAAREQLGFWEEACVGIRSGWEFVRSEHHSIGLDIRKLFGGGGQ